MIVQNVIFVLLSIVACVGAFAVVRSANIVHAALYLVVVLGAVSGIYLVIAAEFLAWVQVLIYIGAVMVLLLFGIMLTRSPMGDNDDLDNKNRMPAYVISLSMFVLISTLVLDAFSNDKKIAIGGVQANRTLANGRMDALSQSLIFDNVFAFELVGFLLLAALIGAIVLARKD